MLLTAASALVVLFVVGVCEAVIGLGIADILTQSNLFKPTREAIGEKLMASYFDDEKPWKMVAFYGINCRMCVSFWIIGIIATHVQRTCFETFGQILNRFDTGFRRRIANIQRISLQLRC